MQTSRLPRWLAAALIAALVVLPACGDDDTDNADGATPIPPTDATTAPTSDPEPTSDADPTSDPEPTGDPEPAGDADAAVERALTYVEAVADGDLDAAFDELSARSQDEVGGRAGFEDLRSALSEGIAAYAAAADLTTFALEIEGAEAYTVVLLATVSQEGITDLSATSMIVRTGDDGGVSPFEGLRAGSFVTFEPPPSTAAAEGTVVTIRLTPPDDTIEPQVWVDTEEIRVTRVSDTTDVGAWFFAAPPLDAGPHAVTAVIEGADGALTATSVAYFTFG